MPGFDARFITKALAAQCSGRIAGAPFSGVSTDSRTVGPGELFVALSGPNFDGHDYAARALEKGAAAALVRKGFELEGAPLIKVGDTTRALGDLAAAWRNAHSAFVLGVTGSNGKTTTKEMLASVLGRRHTVLKNKGNFNNHIGLPLTLLGLNESHSACVAEMGMNAPGEIKRLCQISRPDVGLITNVGPAHLGPLGSVEAVARAKTEMFRELGPSAAAVINLDDPHLAPWSGKLRCRVITFGASDAAHVRGRDWSALGTRQAFSLFLPHNEPMRVRLAAPGEHNMMNALAAAAAAWAIGISAGNIQAGLEAFEPVKGRLALKRSFFGFQILDDTYNANPASLAAGLGALKAVAGTRPKALVLGDMRELGPTSPQLHRQAGANAVEAGCSVVLAVGEHAGEVAQGARRAGLGPDQALAFDNQRDLAFAAFEALGEDYIVLIKGSRSSSMEKVSEALETGEVA